MAAGRAIWFYGADATGKSTVGWEVYGQLVSHGVAAAYVDTDYLGFCHPRPEPAAELVAANLGAVWANYALHGVEQLVISGILVTAEDRRTFEAALTGCTLTTVLLQAAPATIRARILRRRQVEAAEQGTTLDGAAEHELAEYATRSARFAALLETGCFADHRLQTDDGSPAQLAAEALDRVERAVPVPAPAE